MTGNNPSAWTNTSWPHNPKLASMNEVVNQQCHIKSFKPGCLFKLHKDSWLDKYVEYRGIFMCLYITNTFMVALHVSEKKFTFVSVNHILEFQKL